MVDHSVRSTRVIAHLVALARQTLPPMHPAGRPFVATAGALTLLAATRSRSAGLLAAVGTTAVAAFFREPHRVTPRTPGVVVAPADGVVALVDDAVPPPELDWAPAPHPRVSVFLSIFDVHVQRMPADGQVERIAYRPGAFLSADLDKASEDNERNCVLLRTAGDQHLAVVQIAGLVARRIVCEVGEGAHVTAGQTYGLIRFGSRVDTYLPAGSRPLVHCGQRAVGGETVLARLPHSEGV